MALPVKKHVLVLNYPAFGHMIPLLEFSRKISKIHKVTFVVPHCVTDLLRKRELFVDNSNDDLVLHGVQDGSTGNFDNANEIEQFFRYVLPAYTRLLENLPMLTNPESLSEATVNAIVADPFIASSLSSFVDRGVPIYFFNPGPTNLLRFFLVVDENPLVSEKDWECFMEAPNPGSTVPISPYAMPFFMPTRKLFPKVRGVILNTLQSLDKEELALVAAQREFNHLRFYTVGPLLSEETPADQNLRLRYETLQWLANKPRRSVIYVSFGTLATPSDIQTKEIARALLETGRPIIWSLRDANYRALPDELQLTITSSASTFLVLPWVPQKEVLRDPAVGVFLTHGGWNSCLESLSCGVPMVIWPMLGDQQHNAKLMQKMGAGVMLEGTGMRSKRVLSAEDISGKLHAVGDVSQNANPYFLSAQHWKKEIADGLSVTGT